MKDIPVFGEFKGNEIGEHWFDQKANLGAIKINGINVGLYRKCIGYKADLETPIMRFAVFVANDFNMSSPFELAAATIKGLSRKLTNHPHRLVKGT